MAWHDTTQDTNGRGHWTWLCLVFYQMDIARYGTKHGNKWAGLHDLTHFDTFSLEYYF